ncbi:MAG: hypothetical protein KDE27_32845 [Planctomycetes bacterium]|nr:hypothetical protein [Planctomycetota bacterium]
MTHFENDPPEPPESPTFAQELGTGLKREVRTWLRFAMWGAGLGAIALGGAGLWYFGTVGLAIGAAIGAVGGGLGALAFYFLASSETL